ncbi:DUF4083 family protein [Bacillus sp. DJP31]|uniref:DUF4083 family protein n=1 Tax=Bacillus sp. DJP31 TaxID=3409789 RepID=UPI003BB500E4
MEQQAGFSLGDMIFQLITFGLVIAIISVIFILIRGAISNRSEARIVKGKLAHLENKVDQLLHEKENKD